MTEQPYSEANRPIFRQEELHKPLVLYRGDLALKRPDYDPVEASGEVRFEWLPVPHIAYEVWRQEQGIPASADLLTPGEAAVDLVGLTGVPLPPDGEPSSPPPGAGFRRRDSMPSMAFGDGKALRRLVMHIINFGDFTGTSGTQEGGRWHRNRITLRVLGWVVTLDAAPDIEELTRELAGSGGFAFTHTCAVEREDGSLFDEDELEEVMDLVWHFLAFARGRLVGMALYSGMDDGGTLKWLAWRMTLVDWWHGALSWADPRRGDALETVCAGMAGRWQDPFWKDVTRRAIRYFVDANDPRPVDRAIIIAQAMLELLAWSVLVDQNVMTKKQAKDAHAAGRIRAMLDHMGIPTGIPASMKHLPTVGAHDGPQALSWVRNRLAHPKRGEPPYGHDVHVETWRLAQWWSELCLLWLFGFQGEYGNRLIEGRWAGAVEPVPWALQRGTQR